MTCIVDESTFRTVSLLDKGVKIFVGKEFRVFNNDGSSLESHVVTTILIIDSSRYIEVSNLFESKTYKSFYIHLTLGRIFCVFRKL